jgi:hypothetical protein
MYTPKENIMADKPRRRLTSDEKARLAKFMTREVVSEKKKTQGERRGNDQLYAIGMSKLDKGEI